MKVGCLCVSESRHRWRPLLFGISAASYSDQTHVDKDIVVVTAETELYEEALGGHGVIVQSDLRGPKTVCQRMDLGCRVLANRGCDAIAMWDDDDWKHPTFLADCAARLERAPRCVVTGYLWGCYVNARHLWAEDLSKHIRNPWGYWGAALTVRTDAWRALPWSWFKFPGQDPAWCRAWGKDRWAPPVSLDPMRMLSFCHGDNIYQHVRGGGFDLKPWLETGVSESARLAMYRVREAMIAAEYEVPQCDRPY